MVERPDQSFMVYALSYFLVQHVLHNWSNKGRGVCYPVYGMLHIKYPFQSMEKRSP